MKKRIDYLAHVYSETRRPLNNYPEELAKYILSLIPSKRQNNLLDIGCGRGDFLRVFSRLGFKVCEIPVTRYYSKNKVNTKIQTFYQYWQMLKPPLFQFLGLKYKL